MMNRFEIKSRVCARLPCDSGFSNIQTHPARIYFFFVRAQRRRRRRFFLSFRLLAFLHLRLAWFMAVEHSFGFIALPEVEPRSCLRDFPVRFPHESRALVKSIRKLLVLTYQMTRTSRSDRCSASCAASRRNRRRPSIDPSRTADWQRRQWWELSKSLSAEARPLFASSMSASDETCSNYFYAVDAHTQR